MLLTFLFFKVEEIANILHPIKESIFSSNSDKKNYSCDLTKYSPLTDSPNAWYINSMLISHACGGIDGRDYTNSIEALDLALERGHRIIEVDFSITLDNYVVCDHNYGLNVNYDKFMSEKKKYLYSPLDLNMLLDYMQAYPDMYVVTDVKYESVDFIEVLSLIKDTAEKTNRLDILDRFIVQIYYDDDYDNIMDIYPFKNVVYTLYAKQPDDMYSVAEFCLQKGIHVVTIGAPAIYSEDDISMFTQYNIKVFAFTVNDLDEIKKLRHYGVSGFYTDYIINSDLLLIE